MITPPHRPKAQSDLVIIIIVRFHICASIVLCMKKKPAAAAESGISHQLQIQSTILYFHNEQRCNLVLMKNRKVFGAIFICHNDIVKRS